MELVYLYIRKYENIFKDEEFNFSSQFSVTFKDKELQIKENTSAIKQYYGENVTNLTMFLGQNGTGKSTLLDILGMKRSDRADDTYVRKNKKRIVRSSYFILYHLYDAYFGFEFVDDSFLKGDGKISNIDMQYEKEDGALYKLPMGNIFKLENSKFLYCGNIMLQWIRGKDIGTKMEYAYITADKYNGRISNRYRNNDDDGYLFERKYYLGEDSYEYLYKYFVYLKEINNELLQEKNIFIRNKIEVDMNSYIGEKEIEVYLEDRKKELDKLLGVKSEITIQIEEQLYGEKELTDERCEKEKFMQKFYAEAIEYYFLDQLVGWSENEDIVIDVKNPMLGVEDIEIELRKLEDEEEFWDMGMMNIMNFQREFAYLLYQIKRNTTEKGKIDLKNVLRYVLTRVEVAAKNTTDICDKEAVLKISDLIETLPEKFFLNNKNIVIDCSIEKPDEAVIELLRWYDYYFKIRGIEGGSNNVFKLLGIVLPRMSEGQRVFLDLIAKAVSATYSIKPGDNLILLLDEPDRTLHPELARRFLDILLSNINKCQDRKVQIVLTSHSPFVVTDVLPEDVYAIDVKDGQRRIRNNKDTYATNIYYLLMDSFMLDNTFGEYSYKKLKDIVRLLNSGNKLEDRELEEIKKIIDRIGEKTLKKKLLQLYKNKDDSKSKLIEQLIKETNENKIRKVKEILESDD